jgi:hypothetical protein
MSIEDAQTHGPCPSQFLLFLDISYRPQVLRSRSICLMVGFLLSVLAASSRLDILEPQFSLERLLRFPHLRKSVSRPSYFISVS